MKSILLGSAALALANMVALTPAAAQTHSEDQMAQNITVKAETQEFSDGRGSLRTIDFDCRFSDTDTTVLLSPTVGRREANGTGDTAFGIDASLYQDWSDTVSSRTHLFVSEDSSVFARFDVGQDVTLRVADRTNITLGLRWAQYFGGRDAAFQSAGLRQYFRGGSVAYRLTRTVVDGQSDFYSHLVNLSLNDPTGRGRTRFWASAGETATSRAQFDANLSRNDYAFMAQRLQPLTGNFALLASAGFSSYAAPGGRFTGVNLGLGLSMDLN